MIRLRFIQHDGSEQLVEGQEGDSAMETARAHLVPGIIGECGGNCFCGTCHGYIDAGWRAKLPPKTEMEEVVLSGAVNEQEDSRLTCQIKLSPALDGLVIRVPSSQL